ncbi:MAG: lamin tail domain-containing protein, partial [Chthoniobacteraceae bacterium]
TTDNTGLSFDKTFALTVEAAQAPTSVDFSSNTVLASTPLAGVVGSFSTVDPNTADSHVYALVAGAGDTHNGLFSIDGNSLQVAGTLPSLGAVLSLRVRATDLSGLTVESTFTLTVVDTSVRINEFLADNTATTFADEDGDTPDWVELHNPAGNAVNLDGWYLTDDATMLTKWRIPAVSIPANGYRLVFASSKDRAPTNGSPLHANFT